MIQILSNTEIDNTGRYGILFHIPSHCAGCKKALSVLENKQFDWDVYTVDAESEALSGLVDKYKPTTAPTLIIVENGKEVERIVGLKAFLDNHERLFGPTIF